MTHFGNGNKGPKHAAASCRACVSLRLNGDGKFWCAAGYAVRRLAARYWGASVCEGFGRPVIEPIDKAAIKSRKKWLARVDQLRAAGADKSHSPLDHSFEEVEAIE